MQSFTRFLDNLLYRQLEAISIALLSSEGTKLATEDAVIRIVDVAIDNVAGAVADFFLAHEIGNRPDGIQVFAFKKAQRILFGNAFSSDNFLVEVAQRAALNEKLHKTKLRKTAGLAMMRIIRETPNTKLQAPEKLQNSSSKMTRCAWNLELGVSLELGAWCLVFK